MSIQVHCDNCDRSLEKQSPYVEADNARPQLFELYRSPRYFEKEFPSGYVFCHAGCASLFFGKMFEHENSPTEGES